MTETNPITDADEMDFFSLDEVANKLKISRWAVAQAIARGDLKSIKIAKAIRISKSDFRQFLNNSAVEPARTRDKATTEATSHV